MRRIQRSPGVAVWLLSIAGSSGCSDPPRIHVTTSGNPSPGTSFPDTGAPVEEPALPGQEFACADAAAGSVYTSGAARLTAREYASVVRDVLHVELAPGEVATIPDGPPTWGQFDTSTGGVTREHLVAFAELAAKVAGRVNVPALLAEFGDACVGPLEECQEAFFRGFGNIAFRSPALDKEVNLLTDVAAHARAAGFDEERTVRFAIEAALQMPRFLYRLEGQGAATPDAAVRYDLASRLSFGIWGSAPDAELLTFAESGLDQDEPMGQQVERMLGDERAILHAVEFMDDWFDLRRLEDATAYQSAFAELTPTLLEDMREESRALFHHVVSERLPFSRIHDLPWSFLSPALAEHYGLSPVTQEATAYDLSPHPERAGLLTHAALSGAGGLAVSTTERGLFLLEQVLCGTVPEPPATAVQRGLQDAAAMTAGQASTRRVEDPQCASCHGQLEPLAWGLSRYDALGRYQANGDGSGVPLDGWVVFPNEPLAPVFYSGPSGLLSLLAGSQRVQDCALLKIGEYLLHRALLRGDGCWLSVAKASAPTVGATYQELLAALVLAPTFRRRPTETGSP